MAGDHVHQPNASTEDVLDIHSKGDLTALCEVFDSETGAILRSTFTYINKEDVAWFGQIHGITKHELTVQDLRQSLKRVPDEKIYPTPTPHITIVPESDRNTCFIKRPKLLSLDNEEEAKLLPRMLLEEAETLELLRQNPHPNLVRYYGCVVKRSRVIGIALERHKIILQYRHEDDPRVLDIDACMSGIRAGVKHLHSLGFAHNDLNPMNIAFDRDDNPVILDFGSCKKFGEQLVSAGTPGWIVEEYTKSAQRNDESALKLLETWLHNQESERKAEQC